jgi:hypothetical protein
MGTLIFPKFKTVMRAASHGAARPKCPGGSALSSKREYHACPSLLFVFDASSGLYSYLRADLSARMSREAAGPLATHPCELERLFGDNQPMVLEVIEGDPARSPSAHIRLFGFERSA